MDSKQTVTCDSIRALDEVGDLHAQRIPDGAHLVDRCGPGANGLREDEPRGRRRDECRRRCS
jgi:hypothetical protein